MKQSIINQIEAVKNEMGNTFTGNNKDRLNHYKALQNKLASLEASLLKLDDDVIIPKMTDSLKEKLLQANKTLAKLGYVRIYGIMHSDRKTKYNFGSKFVKYNQDESAVVSEFVLNVLTIDELPHN